jgi:hypothetical protein
VVQPNFSFSAPDLNWSNHFNEEEGGLFDSWLIHFNEEESGSVWQLALELVAGAGSRTNLVHLYFVEVYWKYFISPHFNPLWFLISSTKETSKKICGKKIFIVDDLQNAV